MTTRGPLARRAPSPLVGEGWGGGLKRDSSATSTPLPVPPPQGGREPGGIASLLTSRTRSIGPRLRRDDGEPITRKPYDICARNGDTALRAPTISDMRRIV